MITTIAVYKFQRSYWNAASITNMQFLHVQCIQKGMGITYIFRYYFKLLNANYKFLNENRAIFTCIHWYSSLTPAIHALELLYWYNLWVSKESSTEDHVTLSLVTPCGPVTKWWVHRPASRVKHTLFPDFIVTHVCCLVQVSWPQIMF